MCIAFFYLVLGLVAVSGIIMIVCARQREGVAGAAESKFLFIFLLLRLSMVPILSRLHNDNV